MIAEAAILDRLRSVLVGEVAPANPRDLVIVHHAGHARRRSSIYYLGLRGSARTPRWVFKQPNSTCRQQDLRPPLSAADQFAALQRLHQHLRGTDGSVSTPRPVAYLPDLGAYVMEYVPGPTLTKLIRPEAIRRPDKLLGGVVGSAQVLHAVHSVESSVVDQFDLAEVSRRTETRGRELLMAAGLPTKERWLLPTSTTQVVTARKVVLHGDFAPENILLTSPGFCCLEPDLCERDWAEHDVARFLLMLYDAPFFVSGVDVPAVQSLRRRAGDAFLDAYYGNGRPPAVLRTLMCLAVAARWSTRHADLAQRRPPLRRARELLLRRYFGRILDELSVPEWPTRRH